MERKPIRSQTPLHLMVKETVVSKVSRYQDPRKDGRGEGRGGERAWSLPSIDISWSLRPSSSHSFHFSQSHIPHLISSHLISSHLISSYPTQIPLKSLSPRAHINNEKSYAFNINIPCNDRVSTSSGSSFPSRRHIGRSSSEKKSLGRTSFQGFFKHVAIGCFCS